MIPVLTEKPLDTNAIRTENLTLICSADGFPRLGIVWLHNRSMVVTSSRITITNSHSRFNLTSTLTVMNTSFSDSGNYSCVATSPPFDDVWSREALVIIQGKPHNAYYT